MAEKMIGHEAEYNSPENLKKWARAGGVTSPICGWIWAIPKKTYRICLPKIKGVIMKAYDFLGNEMKVGILWSLFN